jgi:mRNA degradation ribonuclease J1/J2
MKNEKIILSDEKISAGDVYVDGNRIGDIRASIIKERQIMANDGIIIVIVNLDITNNKLINKPIISTRGFVLVNENEELSDDIDKQLRVNTIYGVGYVYLVDEDDPNASDLKICIGTDQYGNYIIKSFVLKEE